MTGKHEIATTAAAAAVPVPLNPYGAKVLVALLILSQSAATVETFEVATYEPISVDHGLAAWCILD